MWNTNDLLLMGYAWVRSCRGVGGVEPGSLWPFEDTLHIGLCLEDRHAATFIVRWQGAISFMCASSHAVNSTQWTHPSSSTPLLWVSGTVTGGQKWFEKKESYHHTFYNRLTWWSTLELWLVVRLMCLRHEVLLLFWKMQVWVWLALFLYYRFRRKLMFGNMITEFDLDWAT